MTAPGQKVERRKRMPRAQRERQMLAVAEEIFAERGYLNTSVDEIAERVGVSKPMIYEYFGSKEGLLLATLRQARGELFVATSRAVVGAVDAHDALRRAMIAFFRFVDEHRRSWELLRNETALAGTGAMAEVEAIRNEQSQLNTTLISAFTPAVPQQQLEVIAETLVGACERVALWHVQRDDSTPEGTTDYLLNVVWSGMSALTGSHRPPIRDL